MGGRDAVGTSSNLSPGSITKDWEALEQMSVLEAAYKGKGKIFTPRGKEVKTASLKQQIRKDK